MKIINYTTIKSSEELPAQFAYLKGLEVPEGGLALKLSDNTLEILPTLEEGIQGTVEQEANLREAYMILKAGKEYYHIDKEEKEALDAFMEAREDALRNMVNVPYDTDLNKTNDEG